MPPLPAIRSAALANLAEQLRFAPRTALERDIQRAESLAADLDPGGAYPEDWIAFRVTGYRPDSGLGPPAPGRVLLADLSAFVEHLCDFARSTDAPPGAIDASTLCDRWGISRKTLDRYRRLGLVARRVRGPRPGSVRLFFSRGVVEAFERSHRARLDRAASFSRVDPHARAAILRRARRYRRAFGCTLNQASARLALRFGRSHEGVRRLLLAHDADAREPIFDRRDPLPPRDHRAILRAARRGLEPAAIGERFGKPRAAIVRIIHDAGAAALRAIELHPSAGPTFDRPDAPSVFLAPRAVTHALGWRCPDDFLEIIVLARSLEPSPPAAERQRTLAMAFLLWRAASRIGAMPPSAVPGPLVDAAATDLRWAARLHAILFRQHLPLIVRTIEDLAGRPAESVPALHARALVLAVMRAASDAIAAFDPFTGGRPAAPIGLAAARAGTRSLRLLPDMPPAQRAGRARPVPTLIAIHLPSRIWRPPWHDAVEPDDRIQLVLDRLSPDLGEFLRDRFGYAGPPRTLEEIATSRGVRPVHLARLERRAVREALRLARSRP